MQPNACKFHYIMFESADKVPVNSVLHIHEGVDLKSTNCVKLLGVDIDQSLSFKDHISRICKKAGRQLNALSRLSKILTVEAKLVLVKCFIVSHFKVCPTVWHFCSVADTKKIEKIHEIALRFMAYTTESNLQSVI